MRYPALFEEAPEGGYVVSFRDIPEAITQGDTEEEAMLMAEDVLLSSMDFYFESKRIVPMPSEMTANEKLVSLPASVSAKVLLLNAMLEQKVGPSEVARRLNTRPQDVQRLTNLKHASKIDTIEKALNVLGKNLEVSVS
ncbi:type II toxin-antitoxin system HicB family antitoxin [Aquaspirillum serpens]|uniref:type II toxin-antitoxin system HicB family antitoxin n=1 Tax=Aquaspirillum serpens TaxID=190 RepID=UPI0003B3337B|nr:type II toxin-antitoxin system HicB family antitoxin [Aquaspirillum serpens]